MTKLVYCQYCGQIPGNEGRCEVDRFRDGSHSFVASEEIVLCKYCGKTPRIGSKCSISPFGYKRTLF